MSPYKRFYTQISDLYRLKTSQVTDLFIFFLNFKVIKYAVSCCLDDFKLCLTKGLI